MHESDGIHPGMAVLSADGQRIGHVLEVSEPPPAGRESAGYVRISTEEQAGERQLYTPFTAVREVRSEGLYLAGDEMAAERADGGPVTSRAAAEGLQQDGTALPAPGWSDAAPDQTL